MRAEPDVQVRLFLFAEDFLYDTAVRNLTQLEAAERRVLGALLEKQQATPEYYPLTLKALVAACNQKSNRDPVMLLPEIEVLNSLRVLLQEGLVERISGARADRWEHRVGDTLSYAARAALTLLLLRGPQTVGELRARSERLHAFESLSDVEASLQELARQNPPLAAEQPRRSGQKENRWALCLQGQEQESAQPPAPRFRPAPPAGPLEARVARLEAQIEELKTDLRTLKQILQAG